MWDVFVDGIKCAKKDPVPICHAQKVPGPNLLFCKKGPSPNEKIYKKGPSPNEKNNSFFDSFNFNT